MRRSLGICFVSLGGDAVSASTPRSSRVSLSSGRRPHHTFGWRGAASRLLQGFHRPVCPDLTATVLVLLQQFSRVTFISILTFVLHFSLATRGSLFLHTHFEMISSWNVDLDCIDYTDLFRDNWYKCYVRCTVLY